MVTSPKEILLLDGLLTNRYTVQSTLIFPKFRFYFNLFYQEGVLGKWSWWSVISLSFIFLDKSWFEFGFPSGLNALTKVREPNLSCYLPITGVGKRDGFMHFRKALAWSETQTTSSKIWTWLVKCIWYKGSVSNYLLLDGLPTNGYRVQSAPLFCS